MVRTLEQPAGWLMFSLSILMVYGFLAMFLIGPVHAQQPTFAQMEWPPAPSPECEMVRRSMVDPEDSWHCPEIDYGCVTDAGADWAATPRRRRPTIKSTGSF
jgi:hypothetical protein